MVWSAREEIVYVSGIDSGEKLQMKWGETHQQSCEITLPELRQEPQQATRPWRELSLICTVTPRGNYAPT